MPKCPQLSSILVKTYKTISPPKSSKLSSYLDPTHQNIMLEASLGISTFTLLSLASAPHISNSSPNTKQMKYAYTCSTICSSSQHHARRKYFIFFLSFFFFLVYVKHIKVGKKKREANNPRRASRGRQRPEKKKLRLFYKKRRKCIRSISSDRHAFFPRLRTIRRSSLPSPPPPTTLAMAPPLA